MGYGCVVVVVVVIVVVVVGVVVMGGVVLDGPLGNATGDWQSTRNLKHGLIFPGSRSTKVFSHFDFMKRVEVHSDSCRHECPQKRQSARGLFWKSTKGRIVIVFSWIVY